MTWTVWDILIVLAGIPQLAGLIGVGVVVLRIIKGPVAGMTAKIGDLTARGKALADTSLNVVNANKKHVLAIVADVKGMVEAVRTPDVTQNLPINYGTLRRSFNTLMSIRRGLKTVQGLTQRKPKGAAALTAATAANKRPPRRSIPDRLGLIPPAAKHLTRALPYIRMALNVRKELNQRRG